MSDSQNTRNEHDQPVSSRNSSPTVQELGPDNKGRGIRTDELRGVVAIMGKIAPLAGVFAFLLGLLGFVAERVVWAGQIDTRLKAVEVRAILFDKVIETEATVKNLKEEVIPRLNRIEDKLDRAIQNN